MSTTDLGAAETVDSARDQVGGVLETNLGEQDNEQHHHPQLAALAAIIAVPTRSPASTAKMSPTPASPDRRGFTSIVLIVIGAGGLYALLRHRSWL